MSTLLLSRQARALLLLPVLAGAAVLASCADRQPMEPGTAGPLFAVWPTTEACSATGSAVVPVDGYIREDDWFDACTTRFVADRAGGSEPTTVTARFMDDGQYAYFSALSGNPFSDPGSVLRIFLQQGTTIRAIGVAGGVAAQWNCAENMDGTGYTCGDALPAPSGASGARQNQSGGTGYELAWPLGDLELTVGSIVDVRWETLPGGSAFPTLYPAATASPLRLQISGGTVVDDNDEALPDIIITTNYPVTVTIRNPNADPATDPTAFQCTIAQMVRDGAYVARFNDLPVGTEWVGTAGNKKTCNHEIWPPLDPAYTPDFSVPGKQGALYNEGEGLGVQPLIWTNWLSAAQNADPLTVTGGEGEIREWAIPLVDNGRSAQCTVYGDGTTVYAMEDGRGRGAPSSANQPPPALGLTYAARGACNLTGLPNVPLILQMRNLDGSESTGFLDVNQTSALLFPQSDLVNSTIITDAAGDASPVDLLEMRYGQVDGQSGVFSIMAGFKGWNSKKSEAQVDFEIILDGVQTIKVTAFYGKPNKASTTDWYLTTVQPDQFKGNVAIGQKVAASSAGGSVELLLSGLTFSTAQIRVRSNLAGGTIDNLPDGGYASWPGDNGGSFAVSF